MGRKDRGRQTSLPGFRLGVGRGEAEMPEPMHCFCSSEVFDSWPWLLVDDNGGGVIDGSCY